MSWTALVDLMTPYVGRERAKVCASRLILEVKPRWLPSRAVPVAAKFDPHQPRIPGGRHGGGQWGAVGGAVSKAAKSMRDEATIHDAFGYHDESTGFHTRVKTITDHGHGKPIEVHFTIHDRDGTQIGDVSRVIEADGHTVHHDALILLGPAQGQGFATRLNEHAEKTYREAGIDRIELYANVDVGGFAWARAGYDFASPRDRERVAHKARRDLVQFDPDVQAKIKALLDDPPFTPLQMAMVGWYPGATMWPGKRIMLGAGWHGVKKL